MSSTTASYDEAVSWLREFEEEHGRPLRVLHVGNVAGNAYLNAKFLRAAGAECHVLSYDYYHPIGTPEWEDGVGRPEWFIQGPLPETSKYLLALLDDRKLEARRRRLLLKLLTPAPSQRGMRGTGRMLTGTKAHSRSALWFVRTLGYRARTRIALVRYRLPYVISWVWNWYLRVLGLRVTSVLRRAGLLPAKAAAATSHELAADSSRPDELPIADPRLTARSAIARAFRSAFPVRPDRLTLDEIEQWQYNLQHWQKLVDRYDIVEGYGTDVIRPYVAGKRPYVGYEHGTLRDFTMGDQSTHRMTALAYREADHVFITNGDCLGYAQRLGIERFSPMIHPVDVERHRRNLDGEIEAARSRAAADILLLCPLRHDWAIKGTDVHLRALPLIKAANPDKRVVLVLCEWGAQIEDSKQLLSRLGCAGDVQWMPPLDRNDLVVYLRACDVVLDQIALPHFGATAPQALAAGTPVVMSYEPASTEWIVAEPAPILPAFNPPDVVAAVARAIDPGWRKEFEVRAAQWVEAHHHPERIVAEHCRVYERILKEARPVGH